MNILLIGAGGREHALAWKIKQSPLCKKLFVAPGNAGVNEIAEIIPVVNYDFSDIKNICITKQIDMVVVGPEEPLVKGIYDYLKKDPSLKNLIIIGPNQNAARLEGSKAFAKDFMIRHGIPTAPYKEFSIENYNNAAKFIKNHPLPVVIKADGLAGGKGVVICDNTLEALAEMEMFMKDLKFGDAGKKIVVEKFLKGIELSVFILTDGRHYVLLPEAKDYKRVGENDTGPNTGGMGAISPVPFAGKELMKKIEEKIIIPTMEGIKKDGLDYRGFLYIGLMISDNEPYVIEYNCRLGDPETEVILPRLKNDLVELLVSLANQKLNEVKIDIDPRTVCTIVAASGGYPGSYEKGYPVIGINSLNAKESLLFHMGTAASNGDIVTNGGRVLCVSSFGKNISEAAEKSRNELKKINFKNMYYRTDIGYEFD
ncbi:MAG: phosphoribosylamine--glycine ligase [Chitinophagaceae bacterium]|nr:phosphoribosylamine--glycine ligase [Chitinophagaceae bacterium]